MENKKYPSIDINLSKIRHNTKVIFEECRKHGIELVGVTKAVCGNPVVAKIMIEEGAKKLGDAHIKNIIRLKENGITVPCMLLRVPMISEAEDVVKWLDISLVSEIETIRALSAEARKQNKRHEIILMIETGDLREGVMPFDIAPYVSEILKLSNINLIGIGTNLACLSGSIPSVENMSSLINYKNDIEKNFPIKLKYISGANSSGIEMLFSGNSPKEINQYRIGEAILLGRETINRNKIKGMFQDAFVLKAEIIEIKKKSSKPPCETRQNAFGERLTFKDKGEMLRAVLAIGKQDIYVSGIKPYNSDINIIGANSDQLVLDVTKCSEKYKVGDIISFKLNYSALLSLMTSEYVYKNLIVD